MRYALNPTIRQTIRPIATQNFRSLIQACRAFFGRRIARIRARLCCIASSGSDTEACPRETLVAGPASERWRLRQLIRQRSAALLVATKLSALCPAAVLPGCPVETPAGKAELLTGESEDCRSGAVEVLTICSRDCADGVSDHDGCSCCIGGTGTC